MSAEMHCPKCSSANVILSKKRGAYVCEDCHHVLPEAPVSRVLSAGVKNL
jgi:transcription initiation factor TFIIIB Brf1 subunit/transcription initiation factor TFIIB